MNNEKMFFILILLILKFRVFRNFKIENILSPPKITKDELFDNFIFEFNFSFFRNHLNTQNIE